MRVVAVPGQGRGKGNGNGKGVGVGQENVMMVLDDFVEAEFLDYGVLEGGEDAMEL